MILDSTQITLIIVILVIAWQQWTIRDLQADFDGAMEQQDELIDSHNNFVETVSNVFDGIIKSVEDDNGKG